VSDQDNGSPGSPVSSGLHVCGDPSYIRARKGIPGELPAVFSLKCPSITPEELSNCPD